MLVYGGIEENCTFKAIFEHQDVIEMQMTVSRDGIVFREQGRERRNLNE